MSDLRRPRRRCWRNRKALGVKAVIADAICENGDYGQKYSGKGYYIYEVGARAGRPNPDVEALVVDGAGGSASRDARAKKRRSSSG